jgi:HlyD family secretion protein
MGIADTSGQDIPLPPKSRARRWAAPAALAVVSVAASVLALPALMRWSSAAISVPRERLRLATVHHGDLVRDVSVEGRVVAAVSPTLFAPADGTITLLVESGLEVSKGEALARIESPELENRLAQERSALEELRVELERQRIQARQALLEAQKNVDLAQIALAAAEREKRRADQAFAEKVIPQIDFEKAGDELHNAELAHKHAVEDTQLERDRLNFEERTRALQAQRQELLVAELQRQVDALTVASPVTGLAGNLQVAQKSAVAKNAPIMTVVDLTEFQIEASVPEAYADDLGLQMAAEVRIGNDVHPAAVVAVSPEIVENQVTTRLRFTGEPPPGLRQNQRLTTRILLEEKRGVLMVERGQFLESGAGRVAYVLRDGIAYRRPIEIGARSLSAVEILDGLEDGDVIVSSSLDQFEGAETVLVTD